MKHDPCPQWVHNLAKIETIKKIQRTTCKELGENYILDAQSISNYNMATNHLEILLKCRFWFCRHRMRWDSAFSMSSHVMPMLLIHGPHWVQFSSVQFSSVQFSHSVGSNSLPPHGLQHPRLPFPSPTPGACSNSCPSSRWCHPTISSSVIPFSSCLQSFPASGSFLMSQFYRWQNLDHGLASSKLIEFIALFWSQMAQSASNQSILERPGKTSLRRGRLSWVIKDEPFFRKNLE